MAQLTQEEKIARKEVRAAERKAYRERHPTRCHNGVRYHLATADCETNPFEHGRAVIPFMWDFFDGETHTTFDPNQWDEKGPTLAFLQFLRETPKSYIIYAHNGGKFDWLFLTPIVPLEKIFLIGSRVVSANLYHHEIRDSYSAVPVPLSKFLKGDIDYQKFRPEVRSEHLKEIRTYLHLDTYALYEMMLAFVREFGWTKTMAAAAFKVFSTFHGINARTRFPLQKLTKQTDKEMRPFFFGGRVDCIKDGTRRGHFKSYDVNSMYPFCMATFKHPVGDCCATIGTKITKHTQFLVVEGHNRGAFPLRTPDGLDFWVKYGVFHVTIHEYRAALDCGLFDLVRVHQTYDSREVSHFGKFIDAQYAIRQYAADIGDLANYLFRKLLMNATYGKCAQNPEEFYNYEMFDDDILPEPCYCKQGKRCSCFKWQLHEVLPEIRKMIWKRPSLHKFIDRMNSREKGKYEEWMTPPGYINVMTAASITGAARSILLRAIHAAKNPIYCDTDSIYCESLDVELHPTKLGAWKLEKEFTRMEILGKKLYSVWDGNKFLSAANKGVTLTEAQWINLARDEKLTVYQDAPTISLSGRQSFIKRDIRRNVKDGMRVPKEK